LFAMKVRREASTGVAQGEETKATDIPKMYARTTACAGLSRDVSSIFGAEIKEGRGKMSRRASPMTTKRADETMANVSCSGPDDVAPYTLPKRAAPSPSMHREVAKPREKAADGTIGDRRSSTPPMYPTMKGRVESAQGVRDVRIPARSMTKVEVGEMCVSSFETTDVMVCSMEKSVEETSSCIVGPWILPLLPNPAP